jgi:splicing factor U2AF 65 kDa subunit
MELGDKKLVVQLASIGSSRGGMAGPNSAGAYAPPLSLMGTAAGTGSGEPTNILLLLNMVTPDELKDDEEYMGIIS